MVLVTGTARLRPGQRAAFEAHARPMIAASLAEEGCRAYRYAFDLDDPDLLAFHEEWASVDALRAHFATPHLRTFRAGLRALLVEPPALAVWSAEPVAVDLG